MPSLLVISSAPAAFMNEKPYLDIKFVEGMRYYSKLWDGPVSCILKKGDKAFTFGQSYEFEDLPFCVQLLSSNREIDPEEIRKHDVILCSGDNFKYLHLSGISSKLETKLTYIIEYIPETRHQIVFLDPLRSFPRKIYSLLWTIMQERRRRRAFKKADAIQANGYPAFQHYRSLTPNTIMYLDSRITARLLATETDMLAREKRLTKGLPVRLLHSGRLEPLKGSQDLIPVARELAATDLDFTLDIFGTGSLENTIREGINHFGLQDRVRLHGAIDFESELVPFARRHADIYLSCHRQSDPSCTYIENMGCGLSVIGYANRMWSSLCRESEAGWVAPLGDINELVQAIIEAAKDRQRLINSCRAARLFAGEHCFENEFRKRIKNLRELLPTGDELILVEH